MGVWIRSIKYTVPVKRNLFTIWIASRIISQFQSKIKENLFRPSGPFQLCNITPRHHNYVIDWKKVIKTHKTKCLLYPRKVWLSTKPLKIAWSYFSGQKWPILSRKFRKFEIFRQFRNYIRPFEKWNSRRNDTVPTGCFYLHNISYNIFRILVFQVYVKL